MKRGLAFVALAAVVGGVVFLGQYLGRDRQYRELLTRGEQALEAGNSYAAIEAFSGALALRPRSMVAYYRRGEAYHLQRQDDAAIRDLEEALRIAPDAVQPMTALGRVYDHQGAAGQAAEWSGRAVARLKGAEHEDPILLYTLALAHYRAGAPEAAKAPLLRAVARNDSIGEAHYLLGLVYRDTNDVNAAIAALEHAVRLAPTLTPAREELANLYRVQGRTADEMTQLQHLAAFDDQADRRISIALAEARRGQFESALAALTTAAARSPSDSRVQLAIGRVYLARAERTLDRASIKRALASLEQALGGSARRSEGLALYGRALYVSEYFGEAERILREAAATSPVDREAFAFLADAAERQGHAADARDALINLDALEGDTAASDVRAARARRIGMLSIRANDPRTAAEYLAQAVDLGYVDAATFGLLAQARWQTGDRDAARAALALGLAIDPDHAELVRLSRTIK